MLKHMPLLLSFPSVGDAAPEQTFTAAGWFPGPAEQAGWFCTVSSASEMVGLGLHCWIQRSLLPEAHEHPLLTLTLNLVFEFAQPSAMSPSERHDFYARHVTGLLLSDPVNSCF